uniref:ankyrin repeat-containing protein ITN1-like n=1 Tax=Erigeron canadensis TaxID=72917 RepID=UPI001CB96CCB|nr:ankyrin repeat-containing protein ITN1-like [Erigeron canadensis]
MDRNLFEASLTGNVEVLNALLQKDELILDRVSLTSFNETPLHIAALKGHVDFVTILLAKKPRLAMSLDLLRRTPLHLASSEGHIEIVNELLKVMSPDECRSSDQDGKTPLHLAAMNEQLDVIKVLTETSPDLGRDLLEDRSTILHSCIAYNRLESLKLLSQLWDEEELSKLTDVNGNTLLHLAVIHKQIQTVKYLLQNSSTRTNVNVLNGHGLTALDVLEQCPRDIRGLEIQNLLAEANFQRAKDFKLSQMSIEIKSSDNVNILEISKPKRWISRLWRWYLNNNGNWLEKQRGILILATIIVAITSFYSALHPPGGTITNTKDGTLGNAVQAELDMDSFESFVIQNTVIMVISLFILVVLLSGIPLRNKFCLWVLNLAVFCILVFVTFTYVQQIADMSPDGWVNPASIYMCFIWILLCLLFAFIHTIFFLIWSVKEISKARRMTKTNHPVPV